MFRFMLLLILLLDFVPLAFLRSSDEEWDRSTPASDARAGEDTATEDPCASTSCASALEKSKKASASDVGDAGLNKCSS
jgi:hypothetical protein